MEKLKTKRFKDKELVMASVALVAAMFQNISFLKYTSNVLALSKMQFQFQTQNSKLKKNLSSKSAHTFQFDAE